MAYQTLVLHLLVSAPGDVPAEDLAVVRKAISQWNLNVGKIFGLTVLPVSWSEHAVAEFGERPQAILNDQIVEESDMAVALFYDRLGTPTGEAESGTAEEIDVLEQKGKAVGVLVNVSPRPPLSGAALAERQRLDSYIDELRKRALIFEYGEASGLMGHVNSFLSRAASKLQQNVEQSKQEDIQQASNSIEKDPDPSEGVWPRAEVREEIKTDGKGRTRRERKWTLVLENTSHGPVSDVDFTFEKIEEGALFRVLHHDGPISSMSPGGKVNFPLLLGWGSPKSVECVVTWTDIKGVRRTTHATVRT